jgi:hypothetical protein
MPSRCFGQSVAIAAGLEKGNVCRLATPVLQVVEYPLTKQETLTVENQIWSN